MMRPYLPFFMTRILCTLPLSLGVGTVISMGSIASAIADYTPVNGGSAPHSSGGLNARRLNDYVPPNGGTAPGTSTGTNGVRGDGCSAADTYYSQPLFSTTLFNYSFQLLSSGKCYVPTV